MMAEKDCAHLAGGEFDGIWICAHCYKMLDERPKEYSRGDGFAGLPQIVWQAEIAKCVKSGLTLADFLGEMVKTIRRKSLWTISRHDAMRQSLEALKDQGEKFGGRYADWTKEGAKLLLKEVVFAYWEGNGGSNAAL